MLELQRLRLDHESAVLAFELANRAYFARSINDRGDAYYAEFAQQHRAALADQEAGDAVFHVLVDENGDVVGRFNLYDVADGSAVVGYRLAERVSGRGVATAALRDLVRIAGAQYGLRELKAVTSHENVASQRVLVKAGFIAVGPPTLPAVRESCTNSTCQRHATRLTTPPPGLTTPHRTRTGDGQERRRATAAQAESKPNSGLFAGGQHTGTYFGSLVSSWGPAHPVVYPQSCRRPSS